MFPPTRFLSPSPVCHHPGLVFGNQGFSIIELFVVLALIGLMAGLAVPSLNAGRLDLKTETQRFMGNIRLARAYAVNRGAHYRVTINATSYTVDRLIVPLLFAAFLLVFPSVYVPP